MAKNNTSVEHNLDGNSDCEAYKNEDIGGNGSVVPDSNLDSSDIEVSSVGLGEVSSDHTDSGDEWDDNGPNTVNDATVTANKNIPNWITNLNDITFKHFTQNSGPSLPETDVSVPIALHYVNLLFKPEIFSDIRDHTNTMSSSNKV